MNPATTVENVKPASGKSEFYPTFFLCLLLGLFGVHRFYNRKLGSGFLQLATFGGLAVWWFVDLLMVLLGKFKDENGVPIQNINPKMSWTIAAVVFVIGFASGNSDRRSSSPANLAPSGAREVSESDIVGRWVGTSGGLTALDATLYPGGSCFYSSGDFAGGQASHGRWHLGGRTVTIDLGDGGSSISFSYQNGDLVSGNGLSLHRQ